MHEDATYLPNVRAQYEALPYPARDPEDERKRLINPPSERLFTLNHFCFRGRYDFKDARVLVAGSGTGDSTIYLAEQLRAVPGAQVVSIDISGASNDIAQARARIRGLDNITFLHGSLLDLPDMGLEPFDYINCSGVLHHLADPDAGLRALTAVLKPEGAIGLLLYGEYGRTGVYQMQALMRLVNGGEPDIGVKLANTKAMLAALPPGNWFRRGADLIQDHVRFGDAGIFDLFLHEQDRAYTVPQLYDFVAGAGLKVVDYAQGQDRALLEPASHIRDPALLARVQALDLRTRRAVAELITGRVTKHHVYVARSADTVATPDDPDNVPFLVDLGGEGAHSAMADQVRQRPKAPVQIRNAAFACAVQPGRYTEAILRHLDGRNTLGEIFAQVRAGQGGKGPTDAELRADFAPFYEGLAFAGYMMLRHRSVPVFPDLPSATPARPAPG